MVLGLQEPFIFHAAESEAKSCDRGWTISRGILSHVVWDSRDHFILVMSKYSIVLIMHCDNVIKGIHYSFENFQT